MIELCGLVAYRGMQPLDAKIGRGEVVVVSGDQQARHALFEVLAGQRLPIAGSVHWRDDTRRVLVRAGDELPGGLDEDEALRYYAAAWGRAPSSVHCGGAVARGLVVDANAWLVADGIDELPRGAQTIIDDVADRLRTGSGVLVIADSNVRSDRVWSLQPHESSIVARARVLRGKGVANWRTLIALELRRALRQRAVPALAAVGLLISWLVWTVVPTYEEFWFARGQAGGYHLAAHAVAVIGAVACAAFAAAMGLSSSRVMAETPLGRIGYRRVQRIGAIMPITALSLGTAAASVWAVRSGATSIGNALFFASWPLLIGLIALALAALWDALRVPVGIAAVVTAVVGASTAVVVGGFGLLW